jgi:hypothetical protein
MGQSVSKWVEGKARRKEIDVELSNERRMAYVLSQLNDKRHRHHKTREVATRGGYCEPLRATDVVTDEMVERLRMKKVEAQFVYEPYLRRAAQSEPVVEVMEAKVGSQHYNMPRITLPCAASLEELAALNQGYVSHDMLGGRQRLLRRQEAALAAVGGMERDRFVVDGSGYGALVYVHEAYSEAGLRGKRALLLLHALIGFDKGYMKRCMGSGPSDGERQRHDLKSQTKVCTASNPGPCQGLTPLQRPTTDRHDRPPCCD